MLDVGFKHSWKPELSNVAAEEAQRKALLRGFDPSVPFELSGPAVLSARGRFKAFFQSARNVIIMAVVLSAALLAALLVPLLLNVASRGAGTLRNGTFVLATFHSVASVLVVRQNSTEHAVLAEVGSEPRLMTLLPDGSLLVAQSSNDKPQIIQLSSACSGKESLVFSGNTAALSHPYGLAYDSGIVYVTNQNGNDIVRLNATTGAAIGKENGLFSSLGSPRGLAVSPFSHQVYACSNLENVVVEFSRQSGARLRTLEIVKPVGLLYAGDDMLFVGSNDPVASLIAVVSISKWCVVQVLRDERLSHPAGMALLPPSTLLVLSQNNALLLAWDLNAVEANATIWADNLPARPEGLLVVHC